MKVIQDSGFDPGLAKINSIQDIIGTIDKKDGMTLLY